ncbi:MAG: Asp-tRNA(Asn)/Glu-tRNA(Gln) amidotransferase GatCAB subunit B, partial [Deltaproteobacteria bacterium]|nr:Asp-tRNA(Asn)/Glu-tRNA(Gln) amidotransferase GatCAB subunit B [Deltaproteobacteria bacterium]
YFPDPDLVPVRIEADWLESLRKNLPELPTARLARLQSEFGLPEYDAEVLTSDKTRADNFEAVVKDFPHLSPKQVSNWFLDDPASMSAITPATSGILLTLVEKGTISRNQAKEVLKEVVASGKDPETIIKEKGLVQISDTGELSGAAQEIINANPKEAADYKAGKTKVMGFFVGQLMKKTRGQANPQLANEIFQRLLGED